MIDYSEQIERDLVFFERRTKEIMEKGITKEEAQERLQSAGILDENGEFTEPYEIIGRWIKANNAQK